MQKIRSKISKIVKGEDTFIYNGKRQTIEIKTLSDIEQYTKSRVHIDKF